MATTKAFSIMYTAGATVYFRFMRPNTEEVFDFDDDAWESTLAGCTTPKLAATENTDFGDATDSLYIATVDMQRFKNYVADGREMIVQAVEDLATDVIIGTWEVDIFVMSDEQDAQSNRIRRIYNEVVA